MKLAPVMPSHLKNCCVVLARRAFRTRDGETYILLKVSTFKHVKGIACKRSIRPCIDSHIHRTVAQIPSTGKIEVVQQDFARNVYCTNIQVWRRIAWHISYRCDWRVSNEKPPTALTFNRPKPTWFLYRKHTFGSRSRWNCTMYLHRECGMMHALLDLDMGK